MLVKLLDFASFMVSKLENSTYQIPLHGGLVMYSFNDNYCASRLRVNPFHRENAACLLEINLVSKLKKISCSYYKLLKLQLHIIKGELEAKAK